MAEVTYNPSFSGALGFGSNWPSLKEEEPISHDPYYATAKYIGAPSLSEIDALNKDRLAALGYGRLYYCPSHMAVGDPCRISGDNRVDVAHSANLPSSRVVGFCAYKFSATECYVTHAFRFTAHSSFSGFSGFSGAAGGPVYLTDSSGYSGGAHGTIERIVGVSLSESTALLYADPAVGMGAGGGGISGYSGTSGFSGTFSGFSGQSGRSGYSGTSGFSGTFSGWSGQSGQSGYSATSGFSGLRGESGFSGQGQQGVSGFSGFSSQSGQSGVSGYSGQSGYSAFSGQSGYSGASGVSAYSGQSGHSGTSGYSGVSAFSGLSGYSGTSGFSGTYSGQSGYSGVSGATGSQGISGFSGAPGGGGGSVDGTGSATQIAIWSDTDTLTGSTSLNWEEGDAKLVIAGNCQLADLTATTVYAGTLSTLGSGSNTDTLYITSGPSGESSGNVNIDAGTFVNNPGQIQIGTTNAATIELSSGGPYVSKYVHVASELHAPYITGHHGNLYIDSRGPETGAGYDCNISAGNGSSGEAGGSVVITAGSGSPNGVVQVYKKLLCWGDSNANAPFQILPASGTPSEMSEGVFWIDNSASAGQELRVYIGGVAYYVNLTAV